MYVFENPPWWESSEFEVVRANMAAEDTDRLSDEELIGQMS